MPHFRDIGISTSAYAGLSLPTALGHIARLTASAEIRSFGRHTLLSARNRTAAVRAGLTYSVRGPFSDTGIWDADDAVRLLRAKGFKARRLDTGYPEWERAGLPPARTEPEEQSA